MDISGINYNVELGFKLIEKKLSTPISNDDISYRAKRILEYWYCVLTNMQFYLYHSKYNKSNWKLCKSYILWFEKEWPPITNSKGNWMYPKIWNPPEIIFSQISKVND